jgi:hypothetical protein
MEPAQRVRQCSGWKSRTYRCLKTCMTAPDFNLATAGFEHAAVQRRPAAAQHHNPAHAASRPRMVIGAGKGRVSMAQATARSPLREAGRDPL